MVFLDRIFFQLPPDADAASRERIKKEAEAIFRQLQDGARFLDYANQEGMDDYVPVDQLVPVVAAALRQIKAGEISDLIETPAGYFIVKLRDRRPERAAVFNDVKMDIRELLIQQRTDEELSTWLKAQREIADIRILLKEIEQ